MTKPGSKNCIVELAQVSKIFGMDGQSVRALREVSLRLFPGELVLLLGPSGSGKTTLLTIAAGLAEPSDGTVFLFGKRTDDYTQEERQRTRAGRIGFIFQNFLLMEPLTVSENIEMVLGFCGHNTRRCRARAHDLLRQFKIEHLAGRFPPELSQGEKQRVAIVRAIANDAQLIIADEPTASLESNQGMEVIQTLRRFAAEDERCVLVASHDLRLRRNADRVVSLRDGRIEGRFKKQEASKEMAQGRSWARDRQQNRAPEVF